MNKKEDNVNRRKVMEAVKEFFRTKEELTEENVDDCFELIDRIKKVPDVEEDDDNKPRKYTLRFSVERIDGFDDYKPISAKIVSRVGDEGENEMELLEEMLPSLRKMLKRTEEEG